MLKNPKKITKMSEKEIEMIERWDRIAESCGTLNAANICIAIEVERLADAIERLERMKLI